MLNAAYQQMFKKSLIGKIYILDLVCLVEKKNSSKDDTLLTSISRKDSFL